ncbi:AraC family transcriptional regulator [Massilia sp. Dwa41.01b]|uniref:AraC family transcriptional regulator n=1 Tax=unclassified Massilia TaxID=2609279 RepID=UPI0016040AA8|nr:MULTISPECIES: AraC family transcriptional regulator [unclassified Massilia]QNA87442.1 AraC family transcriptional regulator [Massilia sp. Dwa41.01b]QNA98349.1 AraC family transcriptional regulator [Massilia sp. Se16.2.3]
MDKISSLVGRYSFHARVFFNGVFCDANTFAENPASGQLHLVRSGPVIFRQDGLPPLRVDTPAMVFYPRGSAHSLEVADGASAGLLCADISFADGGDNPLARALPERLHVPLAGMPALHHTLELLFAEASANSQGREVILDRLCDVLMIQVLRHEFEHGQLSIGLLAGLADRQLALALGAIHARPNEPWQLETLAREACMSRARFTEHFRNVVGMPPGEYLTRWRIGLAQELLRQGMPVKVVSSEAGYTSAPAFTRAFTGLVGRSPRQWLKEATPDT